MTAVATTMHPRAITRAKRRKRSIQFVDLWLSVTSASLLSILVALGIGRFPTVGGDEGIYTAQAWAITHGAITPYTYTYDHPFFGWAQIAFPVSWAQALHIGGSLTVVNARAVMVVYAFANLMLVFGICRRLGMHQVTSLLAMALTGLSPLFIVESRQVYLDNVAMFWVLLAVWLLLTPTKHQWTYALAGVTFGVGVLSKETVLVFLPALLWLLWKQAYKPIRIFSVVAFAVLGSLTVFIYPLFAILRFELFPGSRHVSLWTNGILYQLANRVSGGSVWMKGSGKYQMMAAWLGYDHFLVVGGAVAALLCLMIPRLRVIGFLFVLFTVPILKPGGYLPVMYIIAGLPFAGIAMGGLADATYNGLRKVPNLRRGFAVTMVALASLAFLVPMVNSYRVTEPRINVDAVTPDREAVNYVNTHALHDETVLIDDAFWVDLQRAGFGGKWQHVSYYKFDLDPSAVKADPTWRSVGYVIVTPEMRNLAGTVGYPRTTAVLAHSTVVASYGSNADLIQVMKVNR